MNNYKTYNNYDTDDTDDNVISDNESCFSDVEYISNYTSESESEYYEEDEDEGKKQNKTCIFKYTKQLQNSQILDKYNYTKYDINTIDYDEKNIYSYFPIDEFPKISEPNNRYSNINRGNKITFEKTKGKKWKLYTYDNNVNSRYSTSFFSKFSSRNLECSNDTSLSQNNNAEKQISSFFSQEELVHIQKISESKKLQENVQDTLQQKNIFNKYRLKLCTNKFEIKNKIIQKKENCDRYDCKYNHSWKEIKNKLISTDYCKYNLTCNKINVEYINIKDKDTKKIRKVRRYKNKENIPKICYKIHEHERTKDFIIRVNNFMK
jgi:hypothetical protein